MGDMADYTNSRLDISKPRFTNKTQHKAAAFMTNGVTCSECGSPMEKKEGSYGDFWGCTNFPKCKGSRGIL